MKLRVVTATLIVGVGALSVALGWWGAERPWREATGWDRVPAAHRPPAGDPWAGTGLAADPPRLVWLGHSGFLVEWKGTRLLLDPNLDGRCTIARRVLERPVAPIDLGAVDVVLISHAHYDHLDLPTLRRLPWVGSLLVPEGAAAYLEGRIHGARIVELSAGESWRDGELEIIAVAAFHHGNRHHPLRSPRRAVGFVVRSGEASLYYAGDTGAGNDFAALRAEYRPQAAILPIGSFSPAVPIGRYHLSPEEAVEAAFELGGPLVVPCHFGTFRLALDAPDEALPRFAAEAAARGLRWTLPRLPSPAEEPGAAR